MYLKDATIRDQTAQLTALTESRVADGDAAALRVTEMNAVVTTLREELETSNARDADEIQSLTSLRDSLSAEVDQLMGFNMELNTEVANLKNDLNFDSKAGSKGARPTQHRAALALLQSDMDDTKKALDEATETIAELRVQLSDQSALKTLRDENASIRESLESVERDRDGLIQEINDLMVIQTQLKQELETAQQDSHLTGNDGSGLFGRASLVGLSAAGGALQAMDMEDQLDRARRDALAARTTEAATQAELRHAMKTVTQLQHDLSKMTEERDDVVSERDRLLFEANEHLSTQQEMRVELDLGRDARSTAPPSGGSARGLIRTGSSSAVRLQVAEELAGELEEKIKSLTKTDGLAREALAVSTGKLAALERTHQSDLREHAAETKRLAEEVRPVEERQIHRGTSFRSL